MKIRRASLLCCVCLTPAVYICNASAFTFSINNGEFYGPGLAVYNDTDRVGIHQFVDAQIRNVVIDQSFHGYVPFANNGPKEPNLIAEKLQEGGRIDGKTSSGIKLNENADTALRLNFRDDVTGESADLLVGAAFGNEALGGGEAIMPDEKGNVVLATSILADPGASDFVKRFDVEFTTGSVQVPFSLLTQQGLSGGQDTAGPLESGSYLIGKLGDYNQDGYIDGMLVQAESSPIDLLVARGNPLAQKRPFSTDIPIPPQVAAALTGNNLVQNYPEVLEYELGREDYSAVLGHILALDEGVESIFGNINRVLVSNDGLKRKQKRDLEAVQRDLIEARRHIVSTTFDIQKLQLRELRSNGSNNTSQRLVHLDRAFVFLKNALESLSRISQSH